MLFKGINVQLVNNKFKRSNAQHSDYSRYCITKFKATKKGRS